MLNTNHPLVLEEKVPISTAIKLTGRMLANERLHVHTYDVPSEKRLQSELWRGKQCLHTAPWRKKEAIFALFFVNLAIL